MNGKGIDGGFEGEIEGDSLRNWERSTILDVSEQIRGVTYSKSGACDISKNGYLPILRANNIQNDKLKFSDLVYVPETCVSKQQLLQPNDVVVAMSSGSASVVGKTAQIRHAWNGAFGAFCGVLRPSPHIEPRYFGLFLRSEEYRKKVSALSKGININNLKREHFQQIEMPVAPLNEQKRIADKLDQTLAIVERTKARLARVPEILKQFRQSVLAAATDGRLTEDWRIESGIIEEWEIVSLDSVVLDFSYGTSTKSTKTGKIPVLRMGNIQDGRLDWNDLVYTSDSLEIEKYKLATGDVLFNRTNSPELVGKSAVYLGQQQAIYAGYLIRVRCSDRLLPKYLNFNLNSPAGRDYCWEVKTDGVSQSNINAKKLAAFSFGLPTVVEQTEIIRRVETLFALADRIEARYKAIAQQVDKLTQSLLAKAFRGELVPQDPNDEPASVLLERIRAERVAVKPSKASRRR